MNDKTSINYKIGFSDSEVISYNSEKEKTIVLLKAWNEKTIKFEFIDCILFLSLENWRISDIIELKSPDSSLFKRALRTTFEEIPIEHSYKLFQFLDLDDDPAIEIVCKDIIISTIEDEETIIRS